MIKIKNLDDEGWITKFTFRNDTYCIVKVDIDNYSWPKVDFAVYDTDGAEIYLTVEQEHSLRTPFSREPHIEKIEKFLKNYSRDLTKSVDNV